MNNFEKQLSASSKRMEAKQMEDIAHIAKPTVHRHISAAWYTTPAAAVAGLLVGLFLQFGSPQQGGTAPTMAVVHDTIVEHVYDTIRVETVAPVLPISTGRCMAEDGIDYSKLISCAY